MPSNFKLRASAPLAANIAQNPLGPLAELPGNWVGHGFNVIALPIFDKTQKKFQLKLNNTIERISFSSLGGEIPNRGNEQDDISLFGVSYTQTVDNAVLPGGGLHFEPGLWLFVPPTDEPSQPATVVRQATIPHGDSLLAQGDGFTVDGGPQIDDVDATPLFILPDGSLQKDTSATYLAQYSDTSLMPPGITADIVLNPNILLRNDIKGQNILKTTVLRVDTKPPGGIVNIPFVVKNANAVNMTSIFWIETVENEDGSQFMQLQYTQTVALDFPVPGPDGKMVNIRWPHISVATLLKR